MHVHQRTKTANYLLVEDPELLALLLSADAAVGAVAVHVGDRLGDGLRAELVDELLHERLRRETLLVHLRPERVLRQLRRRDLEWRTILRNRGIQKHIISGAF